MMNEARKKYLWSVHNAPQRWPANTPETVDAVVLGWGPGGYDIVQRISFIAEGRAHANEVALAAYNLWCIAHEEEVEYAER